MSGPGAWRCALIAFAAAALFALPAAAQSGRTFVSGHGIDTGTCTPTAPCRSFAYAIGETNAGGEITVLDPAGYGLVTISKSISIVNDGVGEAGVTTSGPVDAIGIVAGPGDTVNLRGLTVVGGGVGALGLEIQSAGTVNIQNCVFRDFAQGISVDGGSPNLSISDTVLSGNAETGIQIAPQGTGIAVNIVLERVQLVGNGIEGLTAFGANATGTISVTVADSIAADNSVGFSILSNAGQAAVNLTLLRSRAVNNVLTSNTQEGVQVSGSQATVYLAQSIVAGNGARGYDTKGNTGTIVSFGDNVIVPGSLGNGGTLTPKSRQ